MGRFSYKQTDKKMFAVDIIKMLLINILHYTTNFQKGLIFC